MCIFSSKRSPQCLQYIACSRSVYLRKLYQNKTLAKSLFTFLCGVSKGSAKALRAFTKPFKVFIKPFEAPEKSVKIKKKNSKFLNTTF